MIDRLRAHCAWLKSQPVAETHAVLLYETLLTLLEQGQQTMTDVTDLKTQVDQILVDEADLKAATAAGIAAVIAKLNVAQPDLTSISVALGAIHANLVADKQAVADETAQILNPPAPAPAPPADVPVDAPTS